jgi:hypothetical protein
MGATGLEPMTPSYATWSGIPSSAALRGHSGTLALANVLLLEYQDLLARKSARWPTVSTAAQENGRSRSSAEVRLRDTTPMTASRLQSAWRSILPGHDPELSN